MADQRQRPFPSENTSPSEDVPELDAGPGHKKRRSPRFRRVAEEVRPVWTVRSPLESEIACDTLREHGIKCACVQMPSEQARTSSFRYVGAEGDTGMVLTVIVAPEDVERAHQILEEYTDLP
jgi:hypothetical protein